MQAHESLDWRSHQRRLLPFLIGPSEHEQALNVVVLDTKAFAGTSAPRYSVYKSDIWSILLSIPLGSKFCPRTTQLELVLEGKLKHF